MPIDTFDLWEELCQTVNTHQNGMIKPNRQFIKWVNAISIQLFEEKFAGAWQRNQKITDDLANPFLKSFPVKVKDINNPTFDLIEYPADYGHISSVRFYHKGDFKPVEVQCEKIADNDYKYTLPNEVTEQPIPYVDNNRWGAIARHKNKKPAFSRPYATQYEGGFKLMPKGVPYVIIDYFRRPVSATFLYTLGAEDQIIYNPASVKLEWSDLVRNEFITRLKEKFGLFTQQPLIMQSAAQEKITTV